MGQAASAFREALDVARRQGAREGRCILEPHLPGFTEGSETLDLRRAQDVPDGLESPGVTAVGTLAKG